MRRTARNTPQTAGNNAEGAASGAANSPNISRGIFGAILLVFIGMYMLRDIPGEIGRWKMAGAQKLHYQQQDERALAVAADAQRWDPDNSLLIETRVAWLRQQGDLSAAIDVLDNALDYAQTNKELQFRLLFTRADVLQAMNRHGEAIDSANEACELIKAARNPSEKGKNYNPQAINHRAYVIARARAAGFGSDQQLGEAREDMQELIRFWDVNLDAFKSHAASSEAMMNFRVTEVSYLDTHAYVVLQAGGEHQARAALLDFNRCIEMCDHLMALAASQSTELGQSATMRQFMFQLQENKAVIIAHRAEANLALGNKIAAKLDAITAKELGYNKQTGTW